MQMDNFNLATPPYTQAIIPPEGEDLSPTRHKRHYEQGTMLRDPVILQVCYTGVVHVHCANVCQVERTLYRVSIYSLTQSSEFFASTFAIDSGESLEGTSDENPVILPSTVTCAEFDVFLQFKLE